VAQAVEPALQAQSSEFKTQSHQNQKSIHLMKEQMPVMSALLLG
jgi:hypothetical protein